MARTFTRAVLVLLSLTLVTSCGRAVTVTPPQSTPDPACTALFETLPDELGGDRRLTISPATDRTAAWGAPPVVWRCGVEEPAGLREGAQLVEVNGADWLPEELSDGVRFTSAGPQPRIEVTVPSEYPSPAAFLGAFRVSEQ